MRWYCCIMGVWLARSAVFMRTVWRCVVVRGLDACVYLFFDRHIGAVAPIRPRPRVAFHTRVTEIFQREPRERRAVMGLAVGDELLVGNHAGRCVEMMQLVLCFVVLLLFCVVCAFPLDVFCVWF